MIRQYRQPLTLIAGYCLIASLLTTTAFAQLVCLPAPRLLTTKPMGGQVGTSFDVKITGQNLDKSDKLSFSHPGISAKQKLGKDGQPVPYTYEVTIAKDCPKGIHEARVLTRLGVSSTRVFNVGELPEAIQSKANTSLETAMKLDLNSICNAVMTRQKIDFYTFEANKGQRIIVDCAAKGIDSKLNPVVIIADEKGMDLQVERRGGMLDFEVPETGKYVIKLHGLTYDGGPYHFYRLAIRDVAKGEVVSRQPAIQAVNAFSWPPVGLTGKTIRPESEPNNQHAQAQKITLPCDITGSFYPAADVDTFEFTAKKGEVWWVEVASERLGRPTDPSIVVQYVSGEASKETLTDVVELSDIATPIKVSSNGYSYDGPPYNAGSSDIIGKVEIKQDGVHRLQLRDLFGGTRNDPKNIYRLIIRKAEPDFALVGWALHMNLRNGDRSAYSKPIALRAGATMPIEVVVVRRDGFTGEIDLFMDNLPEGVSAAGLRIPKGKTRGIMLISSEANAPRGLTSAAFFGRATINGKLVTRPCRMASMQWPIRDASGEVPSPRLLVDVPVSVSNSELAPITIAPAEKKVWEVTAGEKLTIPLVHARRSEFSGANITLKTYGDGFERVPAFDAPLTKDSSQAVLDLAVLKTAPGDYQISFYGYAVVKYRENLEAVASAKTALMQAQQEAEALTAEAKKLADVAKTAPDAQRVNANTAAKEAAKKAKSAEAIVATSDKQLKSATARSKPKDIVDIIVSTPITIRVNPAKKAK
ncbi:serine protease [uncultured Gimesia sp.]|uniref:serine protease n=1 Tax=uncultured Gimesia sp. TaxID=1678688 RepID=UPI00260D86CF|nr:serine protease [uncultured Gimesia sp.]